jgi:hypothetical protein
LREKDFLNPNEKAEVEKTFGSVEKGESLHFFGKKDKQGGISNLPFMWIWSRIGWLKHKLG